MQQPQIFQHTVFGKVDVLAEGERVLFGATEVATALGYTNPQKAVRDHCREDGCTIRSVIDSLGREQQKRFIDEGNLYRLIVRSRLPSAEKFERWVFDEVLPSIRKHGAYMTGETLEKALTSPDFLIQLANKLKDEQTARIEAETKLEKQQPLVSFAEACMTSPKSLLVREVAKLATKNGVITGEKRLYQKLRDWGWIIKGRTEPTQRGMDAGYFEIKKGAYQHPKGVRTFETTKVTPRGQMYIINRLKKEQDGIQQANGVTP